MSISINDPAPDFQVAATSGKIIRLADFAGRNLIIYFYPKDNTPGCTLEGHDFRKLYSEFQALNTDIVGVSKDSVKSHEKFKSECEFPFELLADIDQTMCQAYDVMKLKKNYGKEYLGIDRSTFLIDAKGVIRRIWRSVKVEGHVAEVLAAVKELAK